MRPQKALFLGCTLVAVVASVWLMAAVYSHHDSDTSIWEEVSDWGDALLSASLPSPRPDDIQPAENPNNEKEQEEQEEQKVGEEGAEGEEGEEGKEQEEQEEEMGNEENEEKEGVADNTNTHENGETKAPAPEDSESNLKKLKESVTVAQRALEMYKRMGRDIEDELEKGSRQHKPAPKEMIAKEKSIQEAIEKKKDEIDKAYEVIRSEVLKAENESLQHDIVVPDSEIGPDGIQPNGNKILVLTAFDGRGSTRQSNISTSLMMNRKEYCDYHGYTHYFVDTTRYEADDKLSRRPAWWKLTAIQEAFTKYPEVEWIWWMDADMIITNQLIDLAEHVLHPYVLSRRLTYGRPVNDLGDHLSGQMYPTQDEVNVANIDIIFSIDRLGINAGSFMIHRSPYTEATIDLWQDPLLITRGFGRAEQDAYIYMYQNDPVVRDHTGFVPQRILNSYTGYEVKEANWQHGDLAIHFAGKNKGKANVQLWHEHFAQIVRVPEEYRLY